MSVEITSIVISVISLSGTILATCVGAYLTYYNEERKARRDVNKILLKYRDPLLLSAQDLQARLYGLTDTDLFEFLAMEGEDRDTYRDTIYIYTAYVVGQYLSWVWILRRQAQFMALMSSSKPKWQPWPWGDQKHDSATTLMQMIDRIKKTFSEDTHGDLEKPFILFKAHQSAIGEIMSCQDEKTGEYYCMGFATFTMRWKHGDPALYNQDEQANHKSSKTGNIGDDMAGVSRIPDKDFRAAFRTVEDGINDIWAARQHSREINPNHVWNQRKDGRLRRLQHLLLILTRELDPNGLMRNRQESKFAIGMKGCPCQHEECNPRPLSRAVQTSVSSGPIPDLDKIVSHSSHERNGEVA